MRIISIKKKPSLTPPSSSLPVSKQTAGGVTGAILGGVIGGPVGAVAGAIAGTMMGNRAAEGKTLVSSSALKKAKDAVKAVKKKLPSKFGQTLKKAIGRKPKPPGKATTGIKAPNQKSVKKPVASGAKKPTAKRK